ncbi:MAG: isoprenylcysteine carboxylmethyltransferase family protein [Candidatus Thiodiazotropha endolucinida]
MWVLSVVSTLSEFHIPWKIYVASASGFLGVVISLLGVLEFRKAKTTSDPRVPQQTTSFVKSGIYRLSRNPMYLGFLLILFGWAVYLSQVLSLLLVIAFVLYMNRFQIALEERFMLEKFGDEYVSYKSKVRRWI